MFSVRVLKCAVSGVVGVCALGAAAAVITDTTGYVTFTATDEGNTSSLIAGGARHWSDGQDPHDDADYLVQGNNNPNWFNVNTFLVRTIKEDREAGTFAGRSITFDDGSLNLKMKSGSTQTANWILYGCRIAQGVATASGEFNQRMEGPMLIKGTSSNPSCFTCSANTGDRAITCGCVISGDATAMIKVCRTPTDGADTGGKYARVCFRGDNSAYKGRWQLVGSANNRYYLDFIDALALGTHDPSDGLPLIEVSNNGWLRPQAVAFTNQNFISAKGNLNITSPNGAELSGRRPSEGAYFDNGFGIKGDGTGVLNLAGGGGAICLGDTKISGFKEISITANTVRFYPGYDNRDMPIVVASNALIADGADGLGPVTLKKGGYIQPGVGTGDTGVFGMQSLAVEDGSYYLYSFNATTNDFLRIYGDFVRRGSSPFPIRFETPGVAGVKYKILSAANLGTTVTTNDFVVEGTEKYLNYLITGDFAIEEIEGEKVLTFTPNNTPNVVKLTGTDNAAPTSFDAKGFWDNSAAPSAVNDYVIPSGKLLRCRTEGGVFQGRSLNILGGGDMAICGVSVTFPLLRLFDNGTITIRTDGDINTLKGNVHVHAAQGSPATIELETNNSRILRMPATLHGDGDLRFRYYKTSSSTAMTKVFVNGDNRDFTGGVELHQFKVTVDFANEAAIGGPGKAFRADRITFSSNAVLQVSNSYAIQDPTFGITFKPMGPVGSDGGTMDVQAGQTLEVNVPVAGSVSWRKSGSGTLVIGGTNDNSFSGTFRHKAGTVVFRNAGALAKANIQYYLGAPFRLELDGEPLRLKGTAALQPATDDATILLSTSAFDVRPTRSETVPLLRLAGAAAEAETFDLSIIELDWGKASKGFKRELVAEAEGGDLVISAKVIPSATQILLR